MEHAPATDERTGRTPGRPTSVDRVAVARVALTLWSQHGFDHVTWAQIAEGAGVSERTLLRHFGSKEELAWIGLPRATAILEATFSRITDDASTGEAIAEAVKASLLVLEQNRSHGPIWLRLISEEPALRASARAAYDEWIRGIAAFVEERHPGMPVPASLGIALAYQMTAFEALLEWSQTDLTKDPVAVVDDALSWLAFFPR